MKYQITIAGIFALLCGISTYVIFKPAPVKASDCLIVGTAAGYAPWVSINAQGEYEGFDIDVARALAKEMGKKLVLRDLGCMSSLFMALDQGSIDVIMWGLSITQDRLRKIALICYQGEMTTSYPLLFWKKIPVGIRTINDMRGKLVCIEPASHQDAVMSKYPFIATMSVDKIDDALLNIQYGKADAAFVEPAIAKKFKAKYPEIQILEVPLMLEDQVQGVGIAIQQNNTELIKQVQKAVTTLQSTGQIQALQQQWDIV